MRAAHQAKYLERKERDEMPLSSKLAEVDFAFHPEGGRVNKLCCFARCVCLHGTAHFLLSTYTYPHHQNIFASKIMWLGSKLVTTHPYLHYQGIGKNAPKQKASWQILIVYGQNQWQTGQKSEPQFGLFGSLFRAQITIQVEFTFQRPKAI